VLFDNATKETVTDARKKKIAFCTRLVKHPKNEESYFPSHSDFWYRLFGTNETALWKSACRSEGTWHSGFVSGETNDTMVLLKWNYRKIRSE
jgi:hypothetical protein